MRPSEVFGRVQAPWTDLLSVCLLLNIVASQSFAEFQEVPSLSVCLSGAVFLCVCDRGFIVK
jgi:hypothetical protein